MVAGSKSTMPTGQVSDWWCRERFRFNPEPATQKKQNNGTTRETV
jgi:hypothetical protein